MSNEKQARREAAIKKAKRKKMIIITVCLSLVVVFALLVAFTIIATNRLSEEVIDLTEMGTNFTFAEIERITRSPEAYIGRTIKMRGLYYSLFEPILGRYRHCIAVRPIDDCCPFRGLELVVENDSPFDFPEDETWIEVVGRFGLYEENGMEFHYLTVAVNNIFIMDDIPTDAFPHFAEDTIRADMSDDDTLEDITLNISDYILAADAQEPVAPESPEPIFPDLEPRDRMFDFKSEINDGVLDLTGLGYPGLLEFTEGNLSDYLGVTIKVRGFYSVIHDHNDGGFCVPLIFLTDAGGCCPAMLVFRLGDEYVCPYDYPSVHDDILITGTLVSAPEGRWYRFYLQVDEITFVS